MIKKFLLMLFLIGISINLVGKVDGRMLRQPDVSSTHITFLYAGDIWIVSKEGGIAVRLSSPEGEESFPRFSPDGKSIAYSAFYDGNMEVYHIPVKGGVPERVTWHPVNDRLIDWHPDGKFLLFASSRESGTRRFSQIYTISSKGGVAKKLPVPYGEFASLSPDGKVLAYMPKSRDFRNWKRYRGGGASDIWLFNLESMESRNITGNSAVDGHPMWHNDYLYFLSDRGKNQRQNIWKYNRKSGKAVQVTDFSDFDISFPAIGPEDIVFEKGGNIYLLSLKNETVKKVDIDINADFATLKPKMVKPGKRVNEITLSPDGKRLICEARGDLFTIPAKEGVTKNLTRTSGVREIYPSWSPDGKKLAYISDRSGEYQYYLKTINSRLKDQKLTGFSKGLCYLAYWAPDSKKFAFINNQNRMGILDILTRKITWFDREDGLSHGALEGFRFSWSHDSNWIAYAKVLKNKQSGIMLFNVKTGKRAQVTTGFYNDFSPVFSPSGKYLYFLSKRDLRPINSGLDNTWIYGNSVAVYAATLKKGTPSPLAPENDTFKPCKKKDKSKKPQKKEKKGKSSRKKVKPLIIDFDGLEYRIVKFTKPGRYFNLRAVKGKVLYIVASNRGSKKRETSIKFYDLKKKKEFSLTKASGFKVTADGKKVLAFNPRRMFYIADIKPKQKLKKPVSTAGMMMNVEPVAEWKQMVTDVWRRYRDFFHAEDMHGVDWNRMKIQYLNLLKSAVTRRDVNLVIGNLMAELNSSHTYVGGGDMKRPERENFGLLGVNWEISEGFYRIKDIVKGAPWDNEIRSPLVESGIKVKEGHYILEVNGIPMDTSKEPYAAFQGLGNKVVELTVNNKPQLEGSWKVIVKTLKTEWRLRNFDWINRNRMMVDKLSNGRVGYVFMPDTGGNGLTELVRQYYGQLHKEAFIIDERFNGGGNLPDRFIELLTRTPGHFIDRRNGTIWKSSEMANGGPKVMLINGWSVSGGDAFPYVFKYRKVGPVVGMRTTGGLIGPTVRHQLIDGGRITVPSGRIFGHDGKWFPEGHGVEPDIFVVDDPSILAKGMDPQIKAGVEAALKELKKHPTPKIKIPAPEQRIPKK